MYNGVTPYFCDIALYRIYEKILKLTDCTSEVPVRTWMFGVTVGFTLVSLQVVSIYWLSSDRWYIMKGSWWLGFEGCFYIVFVASHHFLKEPEANRTWCIIYQGPFNFATLKWIQECCVGMCFDLHSNTSNTRLATFCYATKSRGPFAAQPCGITETSQCAMGCHSLGNEQNPPVMFFSKTIQGLVFMVHKEYMHKMRAWFFLYGLYFVSDMVLWTWDWDHEIKVFLFQAHTAKPAKKWIKSLSPLGRGICCGWPWFPVIEHQHPLFIRLQFLRKTQGTKREPGHTMIVAFLQIPLISHWSPVVFFHILVCVFLSMSTWKKFTNRDQTI